MTTRRLQAALVALLAVGGTSIWSLPAGAGTAKIDLPYENQAWFWSTNKEIRQCIGTEEQGLCQVSDGSAASPVEPGHLAVALQLGASDMRSYLRPELGPIEADSDISSFVLTLPVSRTDAADTEHTQHHAGPGAKAPATQSEELAAITACAVGISWGSAEAAPAYAMDKKDPTKTIPVEPFVRTGGVDCSKFGVQGKRVASAWTFDLTSIAKLWATGAYENNGVALLPNQTSGTDSWRVEFHGAAVSVQNNELEQIYVSAKEAGSIKAVFTPPPSPPPPPPPPPPPDTGGFVPPVTQEPPVIAPGPADAPAPEPEQPQAREQPAAEQVASSRPVTPWYAWFVSALFVAGFLLFSRAVGREAGVAGANRVAQVLRNRHTGSQSKEIDP